MVLQVRFLKNTDIGFNRNEVVLVPVPDSSQLKKAVLKQQLAEIPQIKSFTFCFTSPASENNQGGSVRFDNRLDWESWPARSAVGDTSYIKLFGIK